MKAVPAKPIATAPASKRQRNNQSTPLNPTEDARLKALARRFQDIVVTRNKKLGEIENANVDETDVMRAGLLKLETLLDEELRNLILKAKDRV